MLPRGVHDRIKSLYCPPQELISFVRYENDELCPLFHHSRDHLKNMMYIDNSTREARKTSALHRGVQTLTYNNRV